MAPKSRLSAIDSRRSLPPLLTAPRTSLVCLQCRLSASAATRKQFLSAKPLVPSREYASFTDRLRKKIWGTDTPPGQENPYGDSSVIDQLKRVKDLEDERKGTRAQVAPTSEERKELESDGEAPDYVPQATWDGMERVGYESWGREAWDKAHPFEGYMNSDMAERHEVTASIHRALVEVYTLKQEGLPLTMDYHAYDLYNDYPWRLAEDATFESDGHGGMRAVLRSEGLRQDILESVRPREDTAGDVVQREEQTEEYMEGVEPNIGEADSMPDQESTPPTIEPDSLKSEDSEDEEFSRSDRQRAMGGEDQISPADDSWQDVALEDPLIKFAVIKRVMQLTGMRVPDPDVQSITNTKALLGHLVRKPKAKKLAESLFANEVSELPNVQIVDRRYTPVDKEKEVGRWKVIERELTARGLPITGNGAGPKGAMVI